MRTLAGSVLDPVADKTLVTILTVTLAMKGLLPGASHDLLRSHSASCPRFRFHPALVCCVQNVRPDSSAPSPTFPLRRQSRLLRS
ncbi:MAG: hypothetical protein BJ554DRAFT_4810 [Olpidium bornovanus]|uniref:Uncharacterized protein n=1 Tax=Olpidium bornovanus TaxID=278681 RepID=A0A8H7ZMA5_9FUNG|nr:MAG: hypothetical protein BJ554DRAFT_4810 [Olpidium bornovanus]